MSVRRMVPQVTAGDASSKTIASGQVTGAGQLDLAMMVRSDWGRINNARRAVVFAVEAAHAPTMDGEILGMVVSELLENAIKYGATGEPVRVELSGTQESIQIAVTNRLPPGEGHAARIAARAKWVQSFDDPAEAYIQCLTMASEKRSSPAVEGSGLGIARICYEGGCTVRVASTKTTVTVRATTRVDHNSGSDSGAW